MYGIGIGFPIKPTKEDIKKLKREVAHDMFEVVSGGKEKKRAGRNKTEPTDKKN